MRSIPFNLMLIASAVFTSSTHAQQQPWDIGIRAGISAADGQPANDIPTAGVAAHDEPVRGQQP
jgi:hypothetical protein